MLRPTTGWSLRCPHLADARHLPSRVAHDVEVAILRLPESNLETTSGAHVTRDAWYRQKMPMTDEAIANGVYMKTLTKEETLAVMADTVVEHYRATKQYEKAIAVAEVILATYPNSVHAMLSRGTAAAYLLDDNFYQKYPTPADIPVNLRRDYEMLVEINRSAFERAEALGWRPVE